MERAFRQRAEYEGISFEQYAEGYAGRAQVRMDLGDLAGASADFDQALRLNSNLGEVYANRATLRVKLGDFRGAVEDLQRAADLVRAQGDMARYEELLQQIRDLQ